MELTSKALQPEIHRLQLRHEEELAEVDTRGKLEERRLREDMQRQLDSLVADEEQATKVTITN